MQVVNGAADELAAALGRRAGPAVPRPGLGDQLRRRLPLDDRIPGRRPRPVLAGLTVDWLDDRAKGIPVASESRFVTPAGDLIDAG